MNSTVSYRVNGEWHEVPWKPGQPPAARQERTWMDPCPQCGAEPNGFDGEIITVTDNPYAVIGNRNPACEWDPEDPGSPECICGPAIVNPYPDPAYNRTVPVGAVYTLVPCGHTVTKIKIYTAQRAKPKTLGALIEAWAAAADGT